MFYNRFLELCEKKGVKPTPLLKSLNVSPSISDNWKKPNTYPKGDTLKSLANYFDVSVDYLLGRTEIPNAYENIVNTHIKNKSADFVSTDLPTAIAERMRSHNLSLEKFKNLTPQQTDDLLNIIEIFLNNLK